MIIARTNGDDDDDLALVARAAQQQVACAKLRRGCGVEINVVVV